MKSKLAILKSEMMWDREKLDDLFEKFDSSYKKYKRQKEYAFLVEWHLFYKEASSYE